MNIFAIMQQTLIDMNFENKKKLFNECFFTLNKLQKKCPELKIIIQTSINKNKHILNKDAIQFLKYACTFFHISPNNFLIKNLQSKQKKGGSNQKYKDEKTTEKKNEEGESDIERFMKNTFGEHIFEENIPNESKLVEYEIPTQNIVVTNGPITKCATKISLDIQERGETDIKNFELVGIITADQFITYKKLENNAMKLEKDLAYAQVARIDADTNAYKSKNYINTTTEIRRMSFGIPAVATLFLWRLGDTVLTNSFNGLAYVLKGTFGNLEKTIVVLLIWITNQINSMGFVLRNFLMKAPLIGQYIKLVSDEALHIDYFDSNFINEHIDSVLEFLFDTKDPMLGLGCILFYVITALMLWGGLAGMYELLHGDRISMKLGFFNQFGINAHHLINSQTNHNTRKRIKGGNSQKQKQKKKQTTKKIKNKKKIKQFKK
jgi:hypothetical protein